MTDSGTVVLHPFADSGQTTWSGTPICAQCDQPQWYRAHRLEPLDDETKALTERMMGEAE